MTGGTNGRDPLMCGTLLSTLIGVTCYTCVPHNLMAEHWTLWTGWTVPWSHVRTTVPTNNENLPQSDTKQSVGSHFVPYFIYNMMCAPTRTQMPVEKNGKWMSARDERWKSVGERTLTSTILFVRCIHHLMHAQGGAIPSCTLHSIYLVPFDSLRRRI